MKIFYSLIFSSGVKLAYFVLLPKGGCCRSLQLIWLSYLMVLIRSRYNNNYIIMVVYFTIVILDTSLSCANAQMGKVIGSVIAVVVVSTKTARSRILGEFTSANCS